MVLGKDSEASAPLDLEATEMAIRTSMHTVGGVFLEKLIDRDRGHRGPRIPCGGGHEAKFVDYRSKEMATVLATIQVHRAYYYCHSCKSGMAPKDFDLDIVSTSFSPGLRRLMARVGSKEAFDEGRRDLEELAGVFVTTKAVERVSECVGAEIEQVAQRERRAVQSGKIVPIKPVPWMYVEMDGTGVPMVPRETEGRQGKDETGRAKTRELKLGAVFTQTGVDEEGRPVRDPGSTTYVGAIEAAEEFGHRIFTETVRRGSRCANQIVVLGDGAAWIWNLAALHFPAAIEIITRASTSLNSPRRFSNPGVLRKNNGRRNASKNSTMETSMQWSTPWNASDLERISQADKSERTSDIFGPTHTGCGTVISEPWGSLSDPVSSRRVARPSPGAGSSSPACNGPSAAPTPSSPSAVAP